MEKIGNNLFIASDNAIKTDVTDMKVQQGFLEKSNVNPVQEMMGLIEIQRQFESTQKMIRSLDDVFRSAVNQVGQYR